MAKLKWEQANEDNTSQRQGAEYVKKEFHISGSNFFHCPYCIKQVKHLSEHITEFHKPKSSGFKLRKNLGIEIKAKYKEKTLLIGSKSKANVKKTIEPDEFQNCDSGSQDTKTTGRSLLFTIRPLKMRT